MEGKKQDKAIQMVEPVLREDDGVAWMEGEVLFLNFRWMWEEGTPEEVVEEIVRATVHEVVEHVLDEGHEAAVAAEKAID